METVESGVALRDSRSVQPVPRLISALSDSGSSRIGLITLDVKGAGARSAGNPLATCDVAGVGNGIFTEDLRASARPYRSLGMFREVLQSVTALRLGSAVSKRGRHRHQAFHVPRSMREFFAVDLQRKRE